MHAILGLPRTPARRIRTAAGFSVIEVLIAILIIGLVMSAIYGALVATLETKRVIEEEIGEAKRSSLVFEMLERDLRRACVLNGDLALFKCEDGRLAQGDGGKINFVVSSWSNFPDEEDSREKPDGDAPRPRSPFCEVGYFLKPDPDRRDRFILYRREDFYVDSDFEKGGLYLKIASGITELTLEFLKEPTEEDPEPDAEESWDGSKLSCLPRAVRVRIASAPPGEQAQDDDKKKVFEAVVPILAGGAPSEEVPLDESGEGEEEE